MVNVGKDAFKKVVCSVDCTLVLVCFGFSMKLHRIGLTAAHERDLWKRIRMRRRVVDALFGLNADHFRVRKSP